MDTFEQLHGFKEMGGTGRYMLVVTNNQASENEVAADIGTCLAAMKNRGLIKNVVGRRSPTFTAVTFDADGTRNAKEAEDLFKISVHQADEVRLFEGK